MSGPVPIPLSRAASESRTDPVLDSAGRDTPDMRGRPGRLSVDNASAITRRITLLAVLVGFVLALGKAVVFFQSGSIGVLASLVHSGLDMTGAIASFFAVRFAARRPSGQYRHGRGKAEGVAAVFQMCLIVLAPPRTCSKNPSCISVTDHAVGNSSFAAAAMAMLAGLTLWLIIAQGWAIRATGSLAVRGDRAHYTADMLGNVAVVIGLVVASQAGLGWVDGVVGVLFSAWLLYTAYRIGRLAWGQLMDIELPEDERAYLTSLARQDARVRRVSALRTRAAGPHIHIQMQVDLDDALSLQDAHDVCVGVERRVTGVYRAADVSVSPHPVVCDVHSH